MAKKVKKEKEKEVVTPVAEEVVEIAQEVSGAIPVDIPINETREKITTTENFMKPPEAALKELPPIEVQRKTVKIQVTMKRKCMIGDIQYLFLPDKEYEVPRNVMEVLQSSNILKRVY